MNALLVIWLAAHGCDATTTHLALSRGGVERNPFYTQSPIKNDLLMAGEAAALTIGIKTLGPAHPKLAKLILVAGIGLSGYAAVHNVQTLRIQSRLR